MSEKGKKEENSATNKRVAELEEEVSSHQKTLQRLQAEFENFMKRNEKEKEDFKKYINSEILKDFLPMVDSFEEAKKQLADDIEGKAAVEALHKQFMKILESKGIKPIKATGKKFDYNLHECMMTANDAEKEDDIILEEFQRGYYINDKVLRPSKVKVNKKE